MKIDCLMGTYGRCSLASEALACFLQQSVKAQATLLVYNQHPVPLHFVHPRVRIVNETAPPSALRFIKQRMLELADADADFIHWWDDDDLYLPWHLQDCIDHIGNHVAWKPQSSWVSEDNCKFSRHANNFEGSWIFRAAYLRAAPIETHPTYIEHPVFLQTLDAKLLATTELGGLTSYIYRWATGTQHLSGYGGSCSIEVQREHVQLWRSRSDDVLPGGQLQPADVAVRWQQYLDGIEELVTAEEKKLIQSRVGL